MKNNYKLIISGNLTQINDDMTEINKCFKEINAIIPDHKRQLFIDSWRKLERSIELTKKAKLNKTIMF